MTVAHVEVLVEEPSAEAALRIILPRMLEGISFEIYPCSGKDALMTRLPERLHGYAAWLPDDWRIVDRDDDDCLVLKERMEAVAQEAGLATRGSAIGSVFSVVNRIVSEELEAWYFGDWEAVREAYPKMNATVPVQARYRSPDEIGGGTWEAFERIAKKAGYFPTGLRKIEAARAIATHMDPARNTSPSFCALRDALREMVAT